MRRSLMLGAAVLAAGGAFALVATSSTAIADSSFSVFAFGHGKYIPAPGSNGKTVSKGDQIIITDTLTSTRRDDGRYRVVGHDSGTCVVTRATKSGNERAQCNITESFDDQGRITLQGVIHLFRGHLRTSHLAVTGGTGAFEGASGTATVEPGRHHNTYTFDLS